MRQKNSDQTNWHAITIIVFGIMILLRLVLSNRLPGLLMPDMPHDDGWMLDKAQHILKGDWLGPYDHFTLIKGAFSPILLAFCASIGVSFNILNTAIYCLACIVFVNAARPIIKNKYLQITCFGLLLFNPLSFALHTGQRVYRCGIGQWEILIIFAGIIAILLRRNDNWLSLLKWAILSGITLGVFLLSREDGAWIFPFVLAAICLISVIITREKNNYKKEIVVILLILAIPFSLRTAVALANYLYYGAPIVNDRTDGFYAKVAADLHLITPNSDDDKQYRSKEYRDSYYTIYVSTMEKAFTASSTLNSASKHLRDAIRNWANISQLTFNLKQKTGQPSTDHMLWAIRDGVMSAGHYNSLTESEAFFAKVHKELQASFKNGTLEKRGLLISPLIAPLQKGDLTKSLGLMPMALIDIIKFKDISSAAVPYPSSKRSLTEFSLFSGVDYIPPTAMLFCSGWAFAKDNNTRLTADLCGKNGVIIKNLSFLPGGDVFKHFRSIYKNAGMSRFTFEIEVLDLSYLMLNFYDINGNLFRGIPLNGSSTKGEDELFIYCIDRLIGGSPEVEFYKPFVGRANYVIGLYQEFILPITIIAFFSYLSATFLLILEIYKKTELKTLPAWLIMSGMLFTLLLFIFCMCMITTTSFNALANYMYTAPAYILLLMFCAFSACWGLEAILDSRKRGVL